MQLHQLRPGHRRKKPKLVGRGGKRGTYAGRGIKGQKARAGRRIRPALRDLIKRLPKKRGFRFKSFQPKPVVVNLGQLDKVFAVGSQVSPATLIEKKLIRLRVSEPPRVKILGDGLLTKPLQIVNCLVSRSAKEKIEAAGGTIKNNA